MTPEQIAELRQEKYNATAVALHRVHSDLMMIRVKPDFTRPPHKPGQYTVLGMGFWEPRHPDTQEEAVKPGEEVRLARRSYSISCPVLEGEELLDLDRTDWLEFYIVLVRDTGRPQAPALTPRLFLLNEGERLYMGEKITGNYTLEGVRPDDTVLFLATGTGEAPHNYMLWELLRRGHPGPVLSACCVRYLRDLGYLATHEKLMQRFPNYRYLSLTTREASNEGNKKYIQDLITSGQLEERLGEPLDPARTHVFLCGNPKMIGVPERDRQTGEVRFPEEKGVIEILVQRGFVLDVPSQKLRGSIHYEEYW